MARKLPWTTSKRILPSGDGATYREVVTHAHEPGIVSSRLHNLYTDEILRKNQLLQDNPGALKDLSFGRWVAQIPEDVYMRWHDQYPELRDYTDPRARTRFLLKLIRQNPQYAVQPRGRV